MIKVYVKTNEENYITEINSDIFLEDTDDYIEIDEGEGDKYAHAQGNYLDKPLYDEHGRYNYKLVDGVVVEVKEEDKPEVKPYEPQPTEIELRVQAVEEELNALLGGVEYGQITSGRTIQTSNADVCSDTNR